MMFRQSNAFLQDLSNSFHRWFNFSIHLYSGVSQQFGGVSRRNSQISMTEEEFFLHIYSLSQRFVILTCCHPLIIIFDCGNSFHPSGAIQESFRFDYSKPIISELFILSFQLSFPKSYRCITQIFSIKVRDLFVLSYLNSPIYLRSFANSYR